MAGVTIGQDAASSPSRPGYQAIAAELRRRLAAGDVVDRLPAEAVLVDEFGVARETVRRALRLLLDEGLITASHGRGYFPTSAGDTEAKPLYEVISDDIQARISSGQLKPGEEYPSESELQDHYSASRTTVRRAFVELENQNFVAREGRRRLVKGRKKRS